MKNLSKVLNEKDIATKEYVDPVIFDTTITTYTQDEIKNAIQSRRRIIVDGRHIINALYSDLDCYFFFMEEPNRTGYFSWHPQSKWHYFPTPVAQTNSPTFTGEPKAPTPTSASVVTQIATKGYVDNFVPTEINNQDNVGISIWTGTQTEYDVITTKDANTLYFVME